MSLSELTLSEVEALLEGHRFYSPPWKSYSGTEYPESWSSIGDDGGEDWHLWNLGNAYQDDPQGRWKKGEATFEDVQGLGRVTLETQFGGEGQGDNYYLVLKVVDILSSDGTVRYFKKLGWHASHDGSYLDGDLVEVKPVDRTVTFYE